MLKLSQNIELVEHAEVDRSEIQKFLSSCDDALFYSNPNYLELISRYLDAKCCWVIMRNNQKIKSLMPLLYKDGPFGPVYNSLPFYGSNGSVMQVSNDAQEKAELLQVFLSWLSSSEFAALTLINSPFEKDHSVYRDSWNWDEEDSRMGQVSKIEGLKNVDDMMALYSSPRPRNIRKAEKLGVKVKKGGVEYLDFLYETHRDNIQSIGGMAKSRSFFDLIPNTLSKEDWAIYQGEIDGKAVASLLLLFGNKTVEYFTPVILEEYRTTQALSKVIFEAMLDAAKEGYIYWNWGGTWKNQKGVYDFKKKWGAIDHTYRYFISVKNKSIYEQTQSDLLKYYHGFYTIPFNKLSQTGR